MNTKLFQYIKENGMDILRSCGLLGVVVYFFFHSCFAYFLLSPFLIPIMRGIRKSRLEKKKKELNYQFKNLLNSISSSLNAGYSLENAIKLSEKDLLLVYNQRDVEILSYIRTMKKQIELNMSIEEVLLDFSLQTDLEDVDNFSNTLIICRKAGGNLIKATKQAANIISEKISTNREIQVMVAGKQFEFKIMILFPFLTILFIKVTSPELLDLLYQTFLGRIIMIFSLIVLLGAIVIGHKILDIEV